MLDKLPARDHVVIATIEVVHRFQSRLCRDPGLLGLAAVWVLTSR